VECVKNYYTNGVQFVVKRKIIRKQTKELAGIFVTIY